jgi:hypothetical protein
MKKNELSDHEFLHDISNPLNTALLIISGLKQLKVNNSDYSEKENLNKNTEIIFIEKLIKAENALLKIKDLIDIQRSTGNK